MKNQIPASTITEELIKLIKHSVWANHKWIEFVYSQPDQETRPKELLGHDPVEG